MNTTTLHYDHSSVPKCKDCRIRLDCSSVEHHFNCTGGHSSNFWKSFDFLLPGGDLIFSKEAPPWSSGVSVQNGCIERNVPLKSLREVLENKDGKPELDCRNYVYVIHQILSGKETIHLYLGRNLTSMENDTNACYFHPSIEVLKKCNSDHVNCSPRGQWVINACCIYPELPRGSYIGINSVVEIRTLNDWKEKATSNLEKWIDHNKGKHSITGTTASIIDILRKMNPDCIKMHPRIRMTPKSQQLPKTVDDITQTTIYWLPLLKAKIDELKGLV
jgi:hypothetical protein